MTPSNDDRFWKFIALIEGNGWSDSTSSVSALTTELAKADETTIFWFQETLAQKLHALDTRAHYKKLIWKSGSADPFLYKRLSIVAQGQAYYEKFLAAPFWPRRWPTDWLETLYYVAQDAYLHKTGNEMLFEASVSPESYHNKEGWLS
ncbi:MAG: DUF4240 domain-containing protein [Tateyamaria sp.]|uniref:DUF4240 domain-containing protein n=1 Tax=Tateyamaria sp. TaxID=1929288 RepID=UPI00327ABDA0